MYKKGDFHCHSNASDGKLSPAEVVNLAKAQGLDIMSLTDHDTVSGLSEAVLQGSTIGIKVVPGIELSTLYKGRSIHILGYFKDLESISLKFKNFLKEMSAFRRERAKKIIENLYNFFGIRLDFEKVARDTKGIIARPHIAKSIINEGYNYTFNDIFSRFIGDDCPAYVPNKKLDTISGIELLKSTKAMSVFAHPVLVKGPNIQDLISMPFDGIEAIYPANTQDDTLRLLNFANEYHKIVSAGSDFHGIDENDSKHGIYPGQVYLEEDKIEIFLNKLNSI